MNGDCQLAQPSCKFKRSLVSLSVQLIIDLGRLGAMPVTIVFEDREYLAYPEPLPQARALLTSYFAKQTVCIDRLLGCKYL